MSQRETKLLLLIRYQACACWYLQLLQEARLRLKLPSCLCLKRGGRQSNVRHAGQKCLPRSETWFSFHEPMRYTLSLLLPPLLPHQAGRSWTSSCLSDLRSLFGSSAGTPTCRVNAILSGHCKNYMKQKAGAKKTIVKTSDWLAHLPALDSTCREGIRVCVTCLPCAISAWYGVYCVYQPGFSSRFLWMTAGMIVS